jgi:hypothetical protein
MREYLKESVGSHESVIHVAFRLAVRAYRSTEWLPSPEEFDEAAYNTLSQLRRVLVDGGWKVHIMETLLRWNEEGLLRMPEDAFDVVETEVTRFQDSVEGAIELLREYPAAVKDQIKDAIQKHPDLTE